MNERIENNDISRLPSRTAVLTTKQISVKQAVVFYVYHHERDDMWEFLGNQEINEEDCVVVAIEEIISLDPSILQIGALSKGSYAYRESKSDFWTISKIG
jgi:hypothetical protein